MGEMCCYMRGHVHVALGFMSFIGVCPYHEIATIHRNTPCVIQYV